MSIVDHPGSVAPAEVQKPSYAPIPAARRTPRKRRRWLGALGVIALVAATGFGLRSAGLLDRFLGTGLSDAATYVVRPVDLSITLTESGELKPVKSIDIKCEMDGRQNTILFVADESSKVKKGDLLVKFASDQIEANILSEKTNLSRIESELEAASQDLSIQINKNKSDIDKAESDVQIAELDLQQYVRGDLKQRRISIELDIEQAKLDIELKNDELDKSRKLKQKDYVTATKIRELEFGLIRAEAALEKYELSAEILKEYENPRDLKRKQTTLNQAEQEYVRVKKQAESREKQGRAKVKDVESRVALSTARLERLQNDFDHCKVFSPADGVIQYASGEGGHFREDSRIAAGVSVYKGQTILKIPDTSQMMVTTRIHEADRHLIRPGMPCIVKVPAVPGRTFHGKLIKISQYADSANRWMNPELKEHTAEILLDETDAAVSPGDTAEITLLIGERNDVLAVPVISVYSRGSKNFVFVKDGRKVKAVEVKVGQSNTTMVEVGSGLKAGDRILRFADDDVVATLAKLAPAPATGQPTTAGRGAPDGRRPAMGAGNAGESHMGAGRPDAGRMGSRRPGAESKGKSGEQPKRGKRPEGSRRPAGRGPNAGEKPGGGGG